MNLTEHLMACADLWAEASGKSLARLSTIVANDGKLFARIGSMRLGVTTATLEKFADFFADAGSWPEGRIPAEVGEFIHRVAGISPEADASPDHENGDIGVPPSTDIPAPGAVESIPFTAPGEVSSCPTAALLEGGFYPLGVGVPGVTLVRIDGVALPVICPDCDLRIDDARVLQCQHAICPRRIAA